MPEQITSQKTILRQGVGSNKPYDGAFVKLSAKRWICKGGGQETQSGTAEWQLGVEQPDFGGWTTPEGLMPYISDMTPGEVCSIIRSTAPEMKFLLKMHRVTEELHISPVNNDRVTLRILDEGQSTVSPLNFAHVKVHYRLVLGATGQEVASTFSENEPLSFRLGCCEAMPGLDLAVRRMRTRDVALLKLSPTHAFGPIIFGCLDRPVGDCEFLADYKDADCVQWRHYSPEYRDNYLEVHDLTLLEFENLKLCREVESSEQILALSDSLTNMARRLFSAKRLVAARDVYYEAEECLSAVARSEDPKVRRCGMEGLRKILGELSRTLFSLGQNNQSLESARKLSAVQPSSVDAMWLQARSQRRLKNLNIALGLIDVALRMDKGNLILAKEKARIEQAQQDLHRPDAFRNGSLWHFKEIQ